MKAPSDPKGTGHLPADERARLRAERAARRGSAFAGAPAEPPKPTAPALPPPPAPKAAESPAEPVRGGKK